MVRKLIVVTLVALAGAVGVSFFLPAHYTVHRSLEMDATPEAIFLHLVDLRAWSGWDPMIQDNPNVRSTYGSGPANTTRGSWERWSVAGGVGGRRVITAVEPMKRLSLDLAFDRDASIARMEFLLEPAGDKTRVTWKLEGEVGGAPIARWGGLLMDGRVGPQYDAGLANLARVVAQGPPTVKGN